MINIIAGRLRKNNSVHLSDSFIYIYQLLLNRLPPSSRSTIIFIYECKLFYTYLIVVVYILSYAKNQMCVFINMYMVDYKTEQDVLWESLDDAFSNLDLDTDLAEEVANLERSRIMEALSTHSGNQTKAAKALKLGRVTFIAKAKKYELV